MMKHTQVLDSTIPEK
ncbi:hypothetical protein ZEAMMB73_Zm00001d050068 [Zea mays]|uniref:Uncharacterized protein n=1 Tax=Zea mays TaxID=4577 RepID=A0A1D6PZL4_MAIZE|nr:hypothetical protein ZEAMMB73_Zm00001d050068 [Zea mays]